MGLSGILSSPPALAGNSGAGPPSRLETIFNAKSFGAKGDGVSDDTQAIVASISACGEAGGGTVHFPPGKYVISSTIPVNYSHVSIQGSGWGNTDFVPRVQAGDVFVFGDKSHAPVLNKMADFSIHPSVPMTSGARFIFRTGMGSYSRTLKSTGVFTA